MRKRNLQGGLGPQRAAIALAVAAVVAMSLFASQTLNADRETTEFVPATAALRTAVEAVVECASEAGVTVEAELAPNGILYQFGVSFPGFGTREKAEAAQGNVERVLDDCMAEHDVAAASQAVLAIAAPSRSQLRPVAVECAEANGQDVPTDASADEAIAAAAATSEGARCFVAEVEEMTRSRVAELGGG